MASLEKTICQEEEAIGLMKESLAFGRQVADRLEQCLVKLSGHFERYEEALLPYKGIQSHVDSAASTAPFALTTR